MATIKANVARVKPLAKMLSDLVRTRLMRCSGLSCCCNLSNALTTALIVSPQSNGWDSLKAWKRPRNNAITYFVLASFALYPSWTVACLIAWLVISESMTAFPFIWSCQHSIYPMCVPCEGTSDMHNKIQRALQGQGKSMADREGSA